MILQNLYQTKIECLKDSDNSNYYNINIDSTDVRVVVSLIDFNGNPVTNKSVTLTVDQGTFTSVKSGYTGTIASGNQSVTGTTNSNGQFAVLYSATVWGLATFSTNTVNTQIQVEGWRQVGTKTVSGVTYTASVNGRGTGKIHVASNSISVASGVSHQASDFIPTEYRPHGPNMFLTQRSVANNIIIYAYSNEIGLMNTYTSTQTGISLNSNFHYYYVW